MKGSVAVKIFVGILSLYFIYLIVKSAQMEMSMIAEGYYATKSAHLLHEKNTKQAQIPIINAVYEILYENKNPKKVFKKLTDKLD